MTAYLIFDLIIVAILILFAALGAHRGLILSLCGLLAVVVAFVGASFVARTLSPMVADALEPTRTGQAGPEAADPGEHVVVADQVISSPS